jgi:hypothetical protein
MEGTWTSSDGRKLTLPDEAFEAFWDLVNGKRSGSVSFDVKQGGVAGVENSRLVVTTKLRYK